MTIDEMIRKNEEKINKGRTSVKDLREKKYEYILAIDPDVDKSGTCLLRINPADPRREAASIWADAYTFPQIIDRFTNAALNIGKDNVLVIIEAGWLVSKSCFHEAQGRSAERIAKNVGANHQVGKLLKEMAEHIGLHVELQAPLTKAGHGHDRKYTTDDLRQFIPCLPAGRYNQDTRDAIRIAWHRAGFAEDNNLAVLGEILGKEVCHG